MNTLPWYIYRICTKAWFTFIFSIYSFYAFSQNTVYTPLYTTNDFVKTVNLSKPIGEIAGTFSIAGTGGVTYTIPIYTPPGSNNFEPKISLSYSSQAGNGIAGYGWNISGLSTIGRAGKNIYHNGIVQPVKFNATEDAFLLDGMKLNPISGLNGANGTIYAGESESFSKIETFTSISPDNPNWFKVTTKDGIVMEYGNSLDSKLLTENGTNTIFWFINKIRDLNGNFIEFKYSMNDRSPRITQILYTGNFNTGTAPYNQINFSYSIRTDESEIFEAGTKISAKYLLDKISIVHKNDANVTETIKTYKLKFGTDNIYSFLKELIEYGGDETAFSLNSTIFLYGDKPTNIISYPTNAINGDFDFFSGDFDADGKTDMIVANKDWNEEAGALLHSQYSIYKDIGPMNGGVTVMYTKTLPQGTSIENFKQAKFFNFLSADYDKDGRDDVLFAKTSIVNLNCTEYRRKLENIEINHTKSHNNQTGGYDYTTQSYPYPTDNLGYNYQYDAKGNGNFFFPGDFDGDGNQDYILILGKLKQNGLCDIWQSIPKYTFDCKGFINFPATGEINKEIAGLGVGTNPYPPEYYSGTISEADKINIIDFDGDGKMEMLVTKDQTTYVVSFNKVSQTTGYSFAASVIYTTQLITKNHYCYPGDFNGDRKTDILLRANNNTWSILYSTGIGFDSQPFLFSQTVVFSGSQINENHKLLVADFNGDGKSDILHGYNYWYNQTTLKSKLSLYYSKGSAGAQSNSFYYEQYDYNEMLGGSDLILCDFNGDGRSDFMNNLGTGTMANNYADFVSIKALGQERLLKKVTTGHNVTTSFDYKLLTDKAGYPYFYNRTTSLDAPQNLNPYNYVELPIYAVSSMSIPDGIGGENITTYTYEDAIVHRAGKGFLGYKKVFSKNNISGISSLSENDINTQFALLVPKKQSTYLGSNLLSQTDITTEFVSLSTGNQDIRYNLKIPKTETTDYLNAGKTVISESQYDNFGNITTHIAYTGFKTGSNFTALETLTTNTSYIANASPVPAIPSFITTTNTRAGMAPATNSKSFMYDGKNRVISEVNYYGLPHAVTSAYTYDNFGNILTQTTSASNLPNVHSANTYDAKGRYLVQTQKGSGSSIAQTESFTMDSKWGLPVNVTSSDCLTTTYLYDIFGNLAQTTLPDGNLITQNKSWNVNGSALFYSTIQYSGSNPDVKIYFDKYGREYKRQTEALTSQVDNWHTTLTSFDNKGNIKTKTSSFFEPVETPDITSFLYDQYNRPVATIDYRGTSSTFFTSLGGKMKVVLTSPSGQVSEKIIDASGKIISAKDDGGELVYTYNSQGKQTEVRHGNNVLVSSTFDEYGNQVILEDIDAGKITYEYDAYGRLYRQVDPNGNVTELTYDELNRLSTKKIAEGTITYKYYYNPNTHCSNNNPSQIINYNGIVRNYKYDALQRLERVTQTGTSDGLTHTTDYSYNSNSALLSTKYPSGVIVENTYDDNGYIIEKIASGTGLTEPVVLYTKPVTDGRGRYTAYDLGNGKTTFNTYHKDFPAGTQTDGLQNLSYDFEFSTGNLKKRQDVHTGQGEEFNYDELNRLLDAKVNSFHQFNITYDGTIGNYSMGNISTKTDAGYFTYQDNKQHAIAYITETPMHGQQAVFPIPIQAISHDEQKIRYTSFLKTASISEGNSTYGGAIDLNIEYGADYERVLTYEQVGRVMSSKYFDGNYEELKVGSGPLISIHYISGGDGLCAMLITEEGITRPYFVYTDYLGSILTVTDRSATVVATQNFDAWGRHRNPANWNQLTNDGITKEWLYRGFTGHEMLPNFALINMNGRMYDPITGRMLSPDNYVPTPYGTQGYNRYAYALNNPLVFTDPDGNFPWIALGVAALIGAGTSAATYALGAAISGNWNWGSFIKSVGMGALGGAIGGGFTIIGKTMGAIGQSVGYSMMSNIASNSAVSLAFGNQVNFGSLMGNALGGVIDGVIPQFKGFKGKFNSGKALLNGLAELGINSFRGGLVGGISGGIGSLLNGVDLKSGFTFGFRNGFIGAGARSTINIATFGPTIRPTGNVELALRKMESEKDINLLSGAGSPVYRSGGIMKIFTPGITVGRSLMVGSDMESLDGVNTWVHESYHYFQQLNQTWAGQLGKGMYEQWYLRAIKGIEIYDHQFRLIYNEAAASYYSDSRY